MKKVIYLFVLFFPLVLMSTNCKKDDPTPEPQGITVEDLVGNWDYVSLDFNGTHYTDCNSDLRDAGYGYVNLSLLDVSTSTMTLYDNCIAESVYGYVGIEYEFTFSNNVLDIEGFLLEIQNVETFFETNGEILKFKILNHTIFYFDGGVYTLEKR